MAEILSFKAAQKKQRKKNTTLCKEGHHKWQIDQAKQFDSQQGRLVTIYVCARCGEKKSKLL